MILLSFEGLDGSGKSTQAHLLSDWLVAQGHRVEMVREPGGTAISEQVRAMLLDPGNDIDPFAEFLLFSAARAQLVAGKVNPLLESGVIVICDRFFDSTTAYQGFGRRVAEPEWLDDFHLRVTGGLVPNRTYLIAISAEEARSRRQARSVDDRMEASGHAFHQRVAEGYNWLAQAHPERILALDGRQSIPTIAAAIRQDITRLLEARPAGTVLDTPGLGGNT